MAKKWTNGTRLSTHTRVIRHHLQEKRYEKTEGGIVTDASLAATLLVVLPLPMRHEPRQRFTSRNTISRSQHHTKRSCCYRYGSITVASQPLVMVVWRHHQRYGEGGVYRSYSEACHALAALSPWRRCHVNTVEERGYAIATGRIIIGDTLATVWLMSFNTTVIDETGVTGHCFAISHIGRRRWYDIGECCCYIVISHEQALRIYCRDGTRRLLAARGYMLTYVNSHC